MFTCRACGPIPTPEEPKLAYRNKDPTRSGSKSEMPVRYHQTQSAPLTKSLELLLPPGATAMSDSGMFATGGREGGLAARAEANRPKARGGRSNATAASLTRTMKGVTTKKRAA